MPTVYPQCITDLDTITITAAWPAYSSGEPHSGTDIVTGNHRVYAPQSGTIVTIFTDGGYNGGWGNYIKVRMDTADERYWLAAHFDTLSVSMGQHLNAGDFLGIQGETGHTTGVHTHFEYYVGGAATSYRTDPASILRLPGQAGVYNVSWDADVDPDPGPGPDQPGPSPGPLKIPIWLLFKIANNRR